MSTPLLQVRDPLRGIHHLRPDAASSAQRQRYGACPLAGSACRRKRFRQDRNHEGDHGPATPATGADYPGSDPV